MGSCVFPVKCLFHEPRALPSRRQTLFVDLAFERQCQKNKPYRERPVRRMLVLWASLPTWAALTHALFQRIFCLQQENILHGQRFSNSNNCHLRWRREEPTVSLVQFSNRRQQTPTEPCICFKDTFGSGSVGNHGAQLGPLEISF